MGWLRDSDGLGAVYTPDGGNFGYPGTPGWVAYRRGELAGTYFVVGERPDAAGPPRLVSGAKTATSAPVAAGLGTAARRTAVRIERVNVGGKMRDVEVRREPDGLFKVVGVVDGRAFEARGETEAAALDAWRSAALTN